MGVVVSLMVLAMILVMGRLWRDRRTLIVTLSLALAAGMLQGCTLPLPGRPSAPSSSDGSPAWTTWSPRDAPNYVRLVGEARIDVPLPPGEVDYSPLDAQGRAGVVRACITSDLIRKGEGRKREEMPDPAGWPKNSRATIVLPNGKTSHDWFWNRCHLLAKSLGGEERTENLITGTRMLNIGANDGQGGMDVFETAIRDWLGSYPDVTVQYVATPVYEGTEPIPRSVFVDVLSSDGSLNERLEVYNAARGYTIDYRSGTYAPEQP